MSLGAVHHQVRDFASPCITFVVRRTTIKNEWKKVMKLKLYYSLWWQWDTDRVCAPSRAALVAQLTFCQWGGGPVRVWPVWHSLKMRHTPFSMSLCDPTTSFKPSQNKHRHTHIDTPLLFHNVTNSHWPLSSCPHSFLYPELTSVLSEKTSYIHALHNYLFSK